MRIGSDTRDLVMIRLRALLTGVVLGVALSFATDRVESMGSPEDQASLRALYGQVLDGWNGGSGTAFASVFDEDAELVGPAGFHIEGRDRIASFHQMLFVGFITRDRMEPCALSGTVGGFPVIAIG